MPDTPSMLDNKRRERIHKDQLGPKALKVSSATELLRELDLTNERWKRKSTWIFRGHNDARWSLIPSLFRFCVDFQIPFDELFLVEEYLHALNRAALPIPSNVLDYTSRAVGRKLMSVTRVHDQFGDFRQHDFTHVAFAVAQHAGIPTRLLEFTYDPFVAAYFASETTNLHEDTSFSAESKSAYLDKVLNDFSAGRNASALLEHALLHFGAARLDLPDELAVWAVETDAMQLRSTLRLLEHPVGGILNLAKQKSVFVFDSNRYELDNDDFRCSQWRAFDGEFSKLVPEKSIYKFTLPISELPVLRELLKKKRYLPSTIEPSYAVVAKAVVAGMREFFSSRFYA